MPLNGDLREEAAGAGTVGAALRAARMARGLDLVAVAGHLRIRAPFLAALEDSRPDQLPGPTYAIAFVRGYAEFLGLDAEATVRRYRDESADLARRPSLVLPSPAPTGSFPGRWPVVAGLVALGAILVGWVFFADDPRAVEVRVPELPERLAQLIVGETSKPTAAPIAPAPRVVVAPTPPIPTPLPPAPPTPAPAAATIPTAPSPPAPLPPAVATAANPTPPAPAPVVPPVLAPMPALASPAPVPPVASAPPAAVPPAVTTPVSPPATVIAARPIVGPEDTPPPPPQALGAAAALAPNDEPPRAPPPLPVANSAPAEGRVFLAHNADARVVVRAKAESWVQVRDRDSAIVFTRVLSPGDSFLVPNRSGLTLWTGNSGALDFLVDGQPTAPIGVQGSVKRNISLDADRLRAGNASPD
jgi:cytoskeletal protein RodZ